MPHEVIFWNDKTRPVEETTLKADKVFFELKLNALLHELFSSLVCISSTWLSVFYWRPQEAVLTASCGRQKKKTDDEEATAVASRCSFLFSLLTALVAGIATVINAS